MKIEEISDFKDDENENNRTAGLQKKRRDSRNFDLFSSSESKESS